MTRVVILGGGPGGYEAALVATELGAQVTLVDRDGLGGACVLTDCVPSKTLIAMSSALTDDEKPDVPAVFARVKTLATAQSLDIGHRLEVEGVRVIRGIGTVAAPGRIEVLDAATLSAIEALDADVVLLATGATPRQIPGSETDGKRILTWRDLYDLPGLPEHLIVVGSGVTGAELASAFRALGSRVTLVSSRDRVLPGEDPDAAEVIDEVFRRRGITVLDHSRADGVDVIDGGVRVRLADGREVLGSHALIAVGSVPQTGGLGLEAALDARGFAVVDRVSRTKMPGIYAAGDCTGVLMLASVAAMQGRIAMWHALGEAVAPLKLAAVASNVFTEPEIATVGVTQRQVDAGEVRARVVKLPLATNARAKMQGFTDGFVKLFCDPTSEAVLGGVIVAPKASELILPVSLAVHNGLRVDQIAYSFSIYPSLAGSITEAARRLMAGLSDAATDLTQ